MSGAEAEKSRLDDAARAGWLYFIAGNTQEEIARKLNVSRAKAQRLVSLSIAQRLITFRLEHPIARCMQLAKQLIEQFGLDYCDVVPTDPATENAVLGIAVSAAAFLEQKLRTDKPITMALGTGRTMRAAVERIPVMECPDHRLVSLVGNISPDGSASFFDVLTRLADVTRARHFPMPLPVVASSATERKQFLALDSVLKVRALAERADIRIFGIGQIDRNAQLHVDGFITRDELLDLMRAGAVGEITGWSYNAEGHILEGSVNARVTSVAHQPHPGRLAVGLAGGRGKIAAIRAALKGRILNGFITDEMTAGALLED
jgi:DNA-binding transcriptional regulator LsrR (DeoR family)